MITKVGNLYKDAGVLNGVRKGWQFLNNKVLPPIGTAANAAFILGLPAYNYASGNSSAGEAIGGSIGALAGDHLGGKFLRHPFIGAMAGYAVGDWLGSKLGNKILPQKKLLQTPYGLRSVTDMQNGLEKTSAVKPGFVRRAANSVWDLIKGTENLKNAKPRSSMLQDLLKHPKTALTAGILTTLGGGYYGHQQFKNTQQAILNQNRDNVIYQY